jgi:hypothetical protein
MVVNFADGAKKACASPGRFDLPTMRFSCGDQ